MSTEYKYCNAFKILTPSLFYEEIKQGEYCVCIVKFKKNTQHISFNLLIKSILDKKNNAEYDSSVCVTKIDPLKYLFAFKKFKSIQYDDMFIMNIVKEFEIDKHIENTQSIYL